MHLPLRSAGTEDKEHCNDYALHGQPLKKHTKTTERDTVTGCRSKDTQSRIKTQARAVKWNSRTAEVCGPAVHTMKSPQRSLSEVLLLWQTLLCPALSPRESVVVEAHEQELALPGFVTPPKQNL